MTCLCTFDEAFDGHRCVCVLHEWCGDVECDKNPDTEERNRALGIFDDEDPHAIDPRDFNSPGVW